MRWRKHKKTSVGKILTGILIGGVLGATVGWLTAPASGVEIRHGLGEKLGNSRRSLEEKIKTGEENVESKARELAEKVNQNVGEVKKKISRRGKEPLPME